MFVFLLCIWYIDFFFIFYLLMIYLCVDYEYFNFICKFRGYMYVILVFNWGVFFKEICLFEL